MMPRGDEQTDRADTFHEADDHAHGLWEVAHRRRLEADRSRADDLRDAGEEEETGEHDAQRPDYKGVHRASFRHEPPRHSG